MKEEKPVLVVHPQIGSVGGSEFKLSVLLELLTRDLGLKTVLATHEVFPVSKLNEVWGTEIKYENLEVINLKFPRRFASWLSYLKWARISKFAKKNANKFSLIISGHNPLLDVEGTISFVGDVTFASIGHSSILRELMHKVVNFVFGLRGEISRNNIIISNSKFSAKVIKDYLGLDSVVIYSPVFVASDPDEVPWEEREDGFVYLGRISREKKVLEIIDVVRSLRERGHDLHLHIVGTGHDKKYLEEVKKNCSGEWCSIEGAKYGKEKEEILLRHKFGINLCEAEAFGISVAEQTSLGEIVFVADSGGQVEIVEDEILRVKNKEDFIRKFEILVRNEDKIEEIRRKLKKKLVEYHKDAFKERVKKILKPYIEYGKVSDSGGN
jgi:glycosyltransferase involved in cell wall biosynthesis